MKTKHLSLTFLSSLCLGALLVSTAVQASEAQKPVVADRRPSISRFNPRPSSPEDLDESVKAIEEDAGLNIKDKKDALEGLLQEAQESQKKAANELLSQQYESRITRIKGRITALNGLEINFEENNTASATSSVQDQSPQRPASPTDSETSSSSPTPEVAVSTQPTEDVFEQLRNQQEALLKKADATASEFEALKEKINLASQLSPNKQRYQDLQPLLDERLIELSVSKKALEQTAITRRAKAIRQTLEKQQAKCLKFYRSQVSKHQQTSINTLISQLDNLRNQAEEIWAKQHKAQSKDKNTIRRKKESNDASNNMHQKPLDNEKVIKEYLDNYKQLFELYGKLNINLKNYRMFIGNTDQFVEELIKVRDQGIPVAPILPEQDEPTSPAIVIAGAGPVSAGPSDTMHQATDVLEEHSSQPVLAPSMLDSDKAHSDSRETKLRDLEQRVEEAITKKAEDQYLTLLGEIGKEKKELGPEINQNNIAFGYRYKQLLDRLVEAQQPRDHETLPAITASPMPTGVPHGTPKESGSSLSPQGTSDSISFAVADTIFTPSERSTLHQKPAPTTPSIKDGEKAPSIDVVAKNQEAPQPSKKALSWFTRLTNSAKAHKIALGCIGLTVAGLVGYRYGNDITKSIAKYLKKLPMVRIAH